MTQRWKQVRLVIAVFLVLAAGVALSARYGSLDGAQAADPAAGSPAAGPKPGNEADEKAIRATAEDFVKAFNAGRCQGGRRSLGDGCRVHRRVGPVLPRPRGDRKGIRRPVPSSIMARP